MSMISNFNNLGLEKNGLVVDKCAVYKATLKLSVQTSCGLSGLSRELLRKIKKLIKASQKKNFEKKCTFLMINVNSTVKLTLASVVTLNNFTSL